ncbi:MAG: glycogen synthase [Deltaproteobacteria bacterium HGW-Deltaproteobacteria-21]|nr:MAG: glycogen synthase [Deltaproteobacteria bacterium HGW-Deltaproteobacteria-21]
MKIAILTKEFPPHVYGGAGIHVEYLSRELRRAAGGRHSIELLCFGDQQETSDRWKVNGVEPPTALDSYDQRHGALLDALYRDVAMLGRLREADVVHCHTWYTHLAGCLLKQMVGAPLVLTTHSLEPHRPWKREQLDTAYRASSWIEKTAYENADGVIAVSQAMKKDVHLLYGVDHDKIRVIHNGIDEDQYRPTKDPSVLKKYGIDPDRPFVLAVARLTRQKGMAHFLDAAGYLESGIQVVMCASTPDTPGMMQETMEKIARVRKRSSNTIIWVTETVPVQDLIVLYSETSVFVCPSIYEPFGIVNLEAMACGAPVVASAVGGIREVVVEGVTGSLVSFETSSEDDSEPRSPETFAKDLANAVNTLIASPEKKREMGLRARERVKEYFSWKAVAEKTLEFYTDLRDTNRA